MKKTRLLDFLLTLALLLDNSTMIAKIKRVKKHRQLKADLLPRR